MDSLRQLHATQISESASLSTQSQSVININLRLQSSATKAQAKMIDLELLKVEAAQASEHLSIVRVRPVDLRPSTVDSLLTRWIRCFLHRTTFRRSTLNSTQTLLDACFTSTGWRSNPPSSTRWSARRTVSRRLFTPQLQRLSSALARCVK